MTSTLNSTSINDVSAKELRRYPLFWSAARYTIREQEGEETYELIETIRKLSIAFERDADPDAGRKLGALLRGLPPIWRWQYCALLLISHILPTLPRTGTISGAVLFAEWSNREPGSLAAVFERLVAAGFGIEAIAEVRREGVRRFGR